MRYAGTAMKGIVFADFVDFVERELPGAAGEIATSAYSPLETYPDGELLGLVSRVARATAVPASEILQRFGAHLFRTLATLYPVFVDGVASPLELLGAIETTVHGEVRKLYPDAAFPRFDVRVMPVPGTLEMVYRSRLPLADLAEGMIRGCVAWFGDAADVAREDLDGADGRAARFTVRATRARSRREVSA
jgi:heme-NO-binding protein